MAGDKLLPQVIDSNLMPTIYFSMDVNDNKTRFIIEILFFAFLLPFLVINSNFKFCKKCFFQDKVFLQTEEFSST